LIDTTLGAFALHTAPGVKQRSVITDALEQRALPLLDLSIAVLYLSPPDPPPAGASAPHCLFSRR
jgi:hypothetical protein